MMRRRIWSELVPLWELRRDPVLEVLARRDVQLLAAVQPAGLGDAVALARRARELELSLGLWPLLEDADGRWLHPENAPRFEGWVNRLLDAVDGLGVATLVLDLEPPIAEVRRLTDGRLGAARAWLRRTLDDRPHRRLAARARAAGMEAIAAVIPPVLLPDRAGAGWRRALGTSLEVEYDAVTAMAYTSLFEGYARGLVRRADAGALLHRFAGLSRATVGSRAAISLGAVGVGALGDEATYRAPAELAEDVAIARAAGVDDLALFDLAGVLGRPPIEAWLDALLETPAARRPPPITARARAAMAALSLTGRALDAVGRR